MAKKREFEIAFVGLRQGIHEFTYILNNEFFQEKGANSADGIAANVKLTLDKHQGFMLLKFNVGGKAMIQCGKCGNPLEADLWDEFNMVVQLTDEPDKKNEEEEDPDLFYISRTESHLDIEDWLYEFVMLSIPSQGLCGNDEQGEPLCNKDVLAKLEQMRAESEVHEANSIWKGLEKFKEN